ncbi:DUF4365 domain-containing protein [Sphingobacterium sp. BIGb0116]|uniref:tetratricopeptide repeat protein n=1 Tax=Sphingobacterium sp. BIGb0116 TaxID=2940619 RepID=UPI002169D1E7|nr:DUF4365 domain-containing protein [Sphingobacterium sp. BIGb0116]MCS4165213.1 tetratricopeptide (TPR) repeat protein [Sphingobacterium sp. BIGb0116]
MAKRTNNHILEDKSRHVFNEVMPDNWVVRDKGKDYGIDCEVEIFDKDGNSTGCLFYVQLKATESDKKYTIKNVSFKYEKIAQFQSYNTPVLIVRYSHYEKKQYFSWANDIISQNNTGNNIIVKFLDEKVLDIETSEKIHDYVLRFNNALKGNFRLPIPTFIEHDIYSDKTNIEAQQYFKKLLTKNNQYFKYVRNETESILQLKIGKSKVYLSLSDIQFSSIAFETENLSEKADEYYSDILLACLCIILFNLNKTEIANAIFFKNNLIRILNLREDFLKHFLPHLLSGDYCEKVLDEIEGIFDIEKDNYLQNISLAILMASKSLNNEKQKICLNFMEKQVEYSTRRDYKLGIAISNYNLGNFHKNLGNWREALKCYFIAKKHNRNYLDQCYYYSDLGGIFFELKKYRISSKLYEKSIQLNTDNLMAKALLGDSLLHIGDYKSAVEYFDEFLTEQRENNRIPKEEWYLKYFSIKTLILSGYPEIQFRNSAESLKSLELNNIEQAIDFDMLNGDAWFQNALAAQDNDDKLQAFVSFVMSALFKKENMFYWVSATISGIITTEESFLHVVDIIKLAYFYHGEKYIDILYEYTTKHFPEVKESMMKLIGNILTEINKPSFTFRVFDNEFNYETHQI